MSIPDWRTGDDRRLAEHRGETEYDPRPADEQACALCGDPVEDFRDRVSREEFEITGTCQRCQDEVFAEPEAVAGDERCPHCGSTVCYVAVLPGPILCGNTGKVVLAQ